MAVNPPGTSDMGRYYTFSVEAFYSGICREGKVFLTDAEVESIIKLLQEEEEASIYTSDMEKKLPEIYHKIDDAAVILMDEILKSIPEEEYEEFQVWVPEEIIDMAGLDPLLC